MTVKSWGGDFLGGGGGFLMSIFQSILELNFLNVNLKYSRAEWVKKLLLLKGEKLQFVESFSSFPKEIDRKRKFKICPGSSFTFEPCEPLASVVGG